MRIGKGGDGFGNCVFIDHGNGIQTRYGHGTKRLVEVGQSVKKGQPIMTVGDTGIAQGNHLHFSVKVNVDPNHIWWSGKFVDPMLYFNEHSIIQLSNNIEINNDTTISKGMFSWPTPGYTHISSPYGPRWGKFHRGIDISGRDIKGTYAYAAADGKVIVSGVNGTLTGGKNGKGYGNYVVIDHRKWIFHKICSRTKKTCTKRSNS